MRTDIARICSWAILAACVSMVGCGGGGGGSTPLLVPSGGTSSGSMYTAGIYMPSSQFKGSCASPRAGNTSDHQGTALDEDLWLRSWTNELYLWYKEVPDINPGTDTPATYFPKLKTSQTNPSGTLKDKPGFHFTYDTAQYALRSQSGVQAGYGFDLEMIASSPPRKGYVGFVEPGSPAENANIQRGAQFVTVDGADFASGSATTLTAGLFPANAGETHTFVIQDPNGTTRNVQLVSANITETPVQNPHVIPNTSVGYMLFNDHIATAESELISAVNTLKTANVTDLVLDIRYNGGGYLYIASELAYMIAGPTQTAGKTFELTQFNDKYTTLDPVTGKANSPTPFYNTSTSNAALPYLNLQKVYVLTGSGTCSASESIINGLKGAGVQVIQIGSTTCGKPYGFYPQDNCGTTYFSIEFRGINNAGFGDYYDGFSPQNSTKLTNAPLPGCSVADDFSHQLGDRAEGLLAAALGYINGGQASCPTPSGFAPGRVTIQSVKSDQSEAADVIVSKSPLRENRWVTPR